MSQVGVASVANVGYATRFTGLCGVMARPGGRPRARVYLSFTTQPYAAGGQLLSAGDLTSLPAVLRASAGRQRR